MFRASEPIEFTNRLIGAGSGVVDEIYTCTKTADGQRLWNTGDRRLTGSKFSEMAHELCARNGIRFNKVLKRHRGRCCDRCRSRFRLRIVGVQLRRLALALWPVRRHVELKGGS